MNYNKIIIIIFLISFSNTQQWNYSADILEKIDKNGENFRIFKSEDNSKNLVNIYKDTISIFTNQAIQYLDEKQFHLQGSVTMINGQDTLYCNKMIFWYELDSLHAIGNVDCKFKDAYLKTDSLIYVKSEGYRGYSFYTYNKSNFYDQHYKMEAKQISYIDRIQKMNLSGNPMVESKNQGMSGEYIELQFIDSLLSQAKIEDDGYVYNYHRAKIKTLGDFQFFKDEMKGNFLNIEMKDGNLQNVLIQGMAESLYYVVNDSLLLIGENIATGDTIRLNYIDNNLSKIRVAGGARGIFIPEIDNSSIDSTLHYTSNSIDYLLQEQKSYLKGDVKIKYQDTELIAGDVEVDWNTNHLFAFNDGETFPQIYSNYQEPMFGEKLEFDLINKRGIISLGETTFNESIFKAKKVYRDEPNIFHMKKGIYTTCDHDLPHYYFKSKRMKMLQGEMIIAKPLWLYIQDIPIIGIPFAILPNKGGERHSGWIMPSFGTKATKGTFFQDFGYYFAPNDYMDLKFLLDFYDKIGIKLKSTLQYKKRYKYNGSIRSTLQRTINQSITDDISDLFTNKSTQDFDIRWKHSHQIDMTQYLAINWSYVTRNDFYQIIGQNLDTRLRQKLESSAVYNKSWPLWSNSLSVSLTETYNLLDEEQEPEYESQVLFYKSRTLPNINFRHSNSKLFGEGDKWFNSINVNFSSRYLGKQKIGHVAINQETHDSDSIIVWEEKDSTDYNNGVKNSLSLSSPQKLFGWLNISPSLNLYEDWIFRYNNGDEQTKGFKRRLTGSLKISSSLTAYGLIPISMLNLSAVRHVLTPSISFTYKPDFSKPILGKELNYFDDNGNDYFSNSLVGSTPTNEIQKINLSIRNGFQLKLADSLNTKIDIMNWNISTGYNLKADSLNWGIIRSSIRIHIPAGLRLDISMNHDMYELDSELRRTNKLNLIPHLTNFSGSTSFALVGYKKTFNEKKGLQDTITNIDDEIFENTNEFHEPDLKENTLWDFSASLAFGMQKQLTENNVVKWKKSFWIKPKLKIKLTEKWKLSYSARLDMIENQLVHHNFYFYRPLHCWEFGFKWVPNGPGKGFMLNIRVKNPDLQDIKVRSSGGRLFGI